MPVREALRELHGEGLVLIEPNRGARVQSLHLGFVEDIFDIRSAIETMLARRAAERRREEHLRRLSVAAARIEDLVTAGDYAAVPAVNREFHAAVNDAAGNPGALSIVDRHWLLMAALWSRYGTDEGRFNSVIDDHRRMVRAIERRDSASAATFMGAHIERAKQDLLDRMAGTPEGKGLLAREGHNA
jgi:DNA-binding GntR family transcriptional regulator